MSASLDLALLGKPAVSLDGRAVSNLGTNKTQALLYYLAVMDEAYSRKHLARLLWASDDERARNSLRVALVALRKAIPEHLDIQRQSVAFRDDCTLNVDVHLFDEYCRALENSDPHAVEELEQAIALYQGDFLEDFHVDGAPAFEDWLLSEREFRRQLAINALDRVAKVYLEARRYEEAKLVLQRLLELEPWLESTHYALMETMSRLGDFNGALAQYQRCVSVLDAELDVEPMPETTALYERIQIARSKPRNGLPVDPTPFVGRSQELDQLNELLLTPGCQLVTIVGLGGMGKTRLALASAKKLSDEAAISFLNGVVYLTVASTRSAALLPSILAEHLEVQLESRDDPLNRVIEYLRNQECLLVLDSFEMLLADHQDHFAVDTIAQILKDCPNVKIMITSREPLHLHEEWRFELRGLEYPEDDAVPDLEAYSAVQLFLQVAEQVRPGYRIQDEDKKAVVELCNLLGGMPLGIKLSAAWLRSLSCHRIVREIGRNLDFLSTRMRDIAPRQRSMRAVLNHVWELLTDDERAIFRSLAVFHGSFSHHAVTTVTRTPQRILDSLVTHSILQSQVVNRHAPSNSKESRPQEVRFSMHQLIRQFALEKLCEVPEHYERISMAHCDYFVGFLKEQTALFSSFDEAVALAAIGTEDENIRAAWRWAVERFNPPALADILYGVSFYYQLKGPFQEAETRCRLAIENIEAQIEAGQVERTAALPVLGKLLAERARFLVHMSRNESAVDVVHEILRLNEELNEPELEAEALASLSRALFYMGDLDHAYDTAQEALELSRRIGMQTVELGSQSMIGFFHLQRNEYDLARGAYEQGIEIARLLKDRRSESTFLNNLGVIAVQQSAYRQATVFYEQALNLAVEIGDRPGEGHRLNNLGRIYSEQRDFSRAEAHLRHALLIAREIDYKLLESNVLLSWGRNAIYTGHWTQAATLLEDSLAIKRRISDLHGEGEVLTYLGLLHHLQGDQATALERSRLGLKVARDADSTFVVHFAQNNIGLALSELSQFDAATEVFQFSLAGRMALGHLNLSLEPRAGLINIALQKQRPADAEEHVEAIVTHLEEGTLDGTDQPFRIFWICYQALLSTNPLLAKQVLLKAKSELSVCADKIAASEMRRSFLQNITFHRFLREAQQK